MGFRSVPSQLSKTLKNNYFGDNVENVQEQTKITIC